jgi:hypothetical protein
MTRNRSRVATVALALASVLLAACVTEVRLAPAEPSWSVVDAVATWTAGEVSIEVPVYTGADEFPVRGEVVNRWEFPVRVAFAPGVPAAGGRDGRVGGDEPAALVAGTRYEVPAARDGRPGRLAFALRADEPWPDLPNAGSRLTWTVTVIGPAGETQCPLRFEVVSADRRASKALKVGVTIVVIAVVVWAIVDSAEDEWSDFNLGMSAR